MDSPLAIMLFDLLFVPVPIAIDVHWLGQDAHRSPSINCSSDDVVPLAQHARRKLALAGVAYRSSKHLLSCGVSTRYGLSGRL